MLFFHLIIIQVIDGRIILETLNEIQAAHIIIKGITIIPLLKNRSVIIIGVKTVLVSMHGRTTRIGEIKENILTETMVSLFGCNFPR